MELLRKRLFQARQRTLMWLLRVFVAILPSDKALLRVVRTVAFAGKPRARGHFDHYAKGHGATRWVSTKTLLNEDPGLQAYFHRHLATALSGSAQKGEVSIPQWAFSNNDWRFALGSMDMIWQRKRGAVEATVSAAYRWSPDADRITRCIHEAADRLKTVGARDFAIAGIPTRYPPSGPAPVAARHIPAYQKLFL